MLTPVRAGMLGALSFLVLLAACDGGRDGGGIEPPDHSGTRVVVLADTHYVEFIAGDPTAEGSNLLASFEELGYDVRPLSQWTPDSLGAALQGARMFVIPEFNYATWATRPRQVDTLITDFVQQGGVLVQAWFLWPIDTLFGWSVYDTLAGNNRFRFQEALAAGTPFAGGPDSLVDNNMTYYTDVAGLPVGSIAPWRNDSSFVPMFAAPAGEGWVIWLGWDWWRAKPAGDEDGGWLSVLDRIDGLP